jgi:hypothetical protein
VEEQLRQARIAEAERRRLEQEVDTFFNQDQIED